MTDRAEQKHTLYSREGLRLICNKSGYIAARFTNLVPHGHLIVKAANCHDDLVAALADVMKSPRLHDNLTPGQYKQVWAKQLAILAKAEKGT